MANSTLTIAFDQSRKTLTLTGRIAIRETVTVTVTNGATLIAAGLTLKIQGRNNHGLTPPIGICTTWAASSANAVGALNLNTEEAIAAFENVGNLGDKAFNILLSTSSEPALEANSVIDILNWPSDTTVDPVTLDQTETIDALDQRVSDLEAAATTAVYNEDFDGIDPLSSSATLKQVISKFNAVLAALQG